MTAAAGAGVGVVVSYRVRLFNAIRDVLYSQPSCIPSLDLIKIISRLAEPPERLVLWRRPLLHALDLVPSSDDDSTGSSLRFCNYHLLADIGSKEYDIPPVAVEFRVSGNSTTSAGGAGGHGDDTVRRYVVTIQPGQGDLHILQSSVDEHDTTGTATGTGTGTGDLPTKQSDSTSTDNKSPPATTNAQATGVISRIKLDAKQAKCFMGAAETMYVTPNPPRRSGGGGGAVVLAVCTTGIGHTRPVTRFTVCVAVCIRRFGICVSCDAVRSVCAVDGR